MKSNAPNKIQRGGKAKGWCVYHEKLVQHDKYTAKCRTARGGKQCKYFTYKIPNFIKKRR